MSKGFEMIPDVVTDYLSVIGGIRTSEYLTGEIPYSIELQCFWMAIQGFVKVREGADKDRQMNWFHCFCLGVVVSYGGGLFTPLWLGRPTAMIANDLCFGACILAYWIVYWTPFDIGYKLCRTFPVALITTLFAELFRVCGIVNFCNAAFDAFKDKPSAYYPIPVFGPIFYATILGNMGPLFVNGFHSYLGNGMPWGFQKGLVCSSFYHFYAHDTTGLIGTQLRHLVKTYFFMSTEQHGLDDRVLPIVVISAFMHIVAVLQMPQLLGPSFSPFTMLSLPKRRTSSPQSIEKQASAQKDARQAQAAVSQQKLESFSKKTPDLGEENQVKEDLPINGEAKEVDGKKKKKKKKGGNKKED